MPIIEGEKYACTSCIKGHRVSGCTHSDRELHHINPKGRPVKQCEHCRGARKSKSHHARCECGDKKDKDKHKDKGDSKGEKLGDASITISSDPPTVGDNKCCCHDGGKCICGLKTEAHGQKHDINSKHAHQTKPKPRLMSTHSESTLTVFANGHHKPCHRLNNTAHTSGAPYKIPRPHTLHGMPSNSSGDLESIYGKYHEASQRSLDSLRLSGNSLYNPSRDAQRSADNLPSMGLDGSSDLGALKFDASFFFNPSSDTLTKQSEHGSPDKSPSGDTLLNAQWPWLSSVVPSSGAFGIEDYSTSPTADFLSSSDNDWIIPSVGLNPLWSAGDLPLDPNKLADNVTQPISLSGESSNISAPGLTASSSGAQSEIGEPALYGDSDMKGQSSTDAPLLYEDGKTQLREQSYRLSSTSILNECGLPPTSMPQTKSRHSFDLNLLKRCSSGSPFDRPAAIDAGQPGYQAPTGDLGQHHKSLGVSPNFVCNPTQPDDSTSFCATIDGALSITIPNTIQEDASSSGSPWLLYGLGNNGVDDLAVYSWLS